MQTQTLPPHRQLLTALINSLSPSPSPPPTTASDTSSSSRTATATATHNNNKKLLSDSASPKRRHLLLTLHVIFPSLLLPALDLLDRRLVSRLTVPLSPQASLAATAAAATHTTTAGIETVNERRAICAYIVQSDTSSASSRRRRDAPSRVLKRYIIHLDAWSCSCASFALDAYPSHAEIMQDEQGGSHALPWSFGGLSLDGQPGAWENVPCCKHLLACLLTERWGNVLDSHVEDRRITKEELAAMIASL